MTCSIATRLGVVYCSSYACKTWRGRSVHRLLQLPDPCLAAILVSTCLGPALAVCSVPCALRIILWPHQAAEQAAASVQCAHHTRRYSHTCVSQTVLMPSALLAHEHAHQASTLHSSIATLVNHHCTDSLNYLRMLHGARLHHCQNACCPLTKGLAACRPP